jgi:hypothetical protein
MFFSKGFVVICIALFTFVQWGLPLYWERLANFNFQFQSFSDNSVVKAQPMIGFKGHCMIWGTLEIDNKSKAPLHIKNTHLVLIPYDIKTCDVKDEKCVKPVNHPTVLEDEKKPLLEYNMVRLMKEFHSTTVYPVTQTHDLFAGGKATRPFIVSVPIEQMNMQRLTVVAAQEYGSRYCESITQDKWYLPQCETSRVIAQMASPCKEFKEVEKSADDSSTEIKLQVTPPSGYVIKQNEN